LTPETFTESNRCFSCGELERTDCLENAPAQCASELPEACYDFVYFSPQSRLRVTEDAPEECQYVNACADHTNSSVAIDVDSVQQCDLRCDENHIDWNPLTGQCVAEYQVNAPEVCEIDNPDYNPLSGQCDLCTPDTPGYDGTAQACLDVQAVEYLVIDYERDKLGRIEKKTGSVEGIKTVYDYDLLGCLVSEIQNGSTTNSWQ